MMQGGLAVTLSAAGPMGVADPPDPAERFRRATGRIPSAVTVITANDGPTRLGTTVATLVPVSDAPPMVMFLASARSVSAAAIIGTGAFGVSVLARGQEAECYRFATSGVDKFAGVAVTESPSGIPMLDGCVFNADCTIESVVPAGDHTAVFGRVTWYDTASGGLTPLVFYRSKIARLDAASGRHIPTEELHWW